MTNTDNQKSNLPGGWVLARLEEVSTIIQGQSPPSSTFNKNKIGLPFFQGKAEFTELHPKIKIWSKVSKKIAEPNDILLSVRAPVGSTNIVNVRCSIGRGLAAIRYTPNYKFLFYYLRFIEKELDKKGSGTTFKAISGEVIRNISLPIPPINEQNRIVSKLDELISELDKGKEQLRTALNQLKVYKQAIQKYAFEGKLNTNIVKWKTIKLGELLDFVGSGATPKGGKKVYVKNGVTFIRSQNVYPNEFRLDNVAYITEEIDEKLKRSRVKENDVLLNITGASIGRCTFVPKNFPKANVNQHVCILRPNKKKLNHKYLSFYLNSFQAQSDIMNAQSGATRQGRNYTQIKNISIPLCNLKEQELIVEKLEIIQDSMRLTRNLIDEQLVKSKSLLHSLFEKAFDGKLVEQDSKDEPVDILLKRLKEEKKEFSRIQRIKKKGNLVHSKTLKMAEELKSILDLLKQSGEPISAKKLWETSIHKNDIDSFYAELKKYIEKGEIEEISRKNKESYLTIINKE